MTGANDIGKLIMYERRSFTAKDKRTVLHGDPEAARERRTCLRDSHDGIVAGSHLLGVIHRQSANALVSGAGKWEIRA